MKKSASLFISLFISFFYAQNSFSQAQVSPTRLTLSEENPSSYLNVRNTTTQPQAYQIQLVHYAMSADGSMKKSQKTDGPLFEKIKFSPKKIEIPAGEKQVVRVMMTNFDDLKEGEDYLHIHFIPVGAKNNAADKDTKGTSFNLQARIAVAVPVVIRKGAGSFAGEFKNLKATRTATGDLELQFDLNNKNSYFIYGDLEVSALADKEVLLDKVIGLTSYLPHRTYKNKIPAKEIKEKMGDTAFSKIKLQYRSNNDSSAPFDFVQTIDVNEKKNKK